MQRFIFQSAIITKDGLYSYQPISMEQARIWLNEGEDPLFRLPLISSVVQAITGRALPHRPGERLFIHTDDEALIMSFDFPGFRHTPPYQRGQLALQRRDVGLAEIQESIRFGLLRKFARLDSYVQSIVQWDPAYRASFRQRYLVHDAILVQYGLYQFSRIDVAGATAWLDEGVYESQLRYDATCKALEVLAECDVTMWDSPSWASLAMNPSDQALVVYFHSPEDKPRPFEPFTGTLSPEYVRRHTNLSLLTRLSEDFVERNRDAFPTALRLPGETRIG